MKRSLFFILLLTGTLVSQAYDFEAVAPTGQTLYYTISSDTTVTVTYPGSSISSPYSDFTAPTGILEIPSSATNPNNGASYSVASIGNYAFYGCSGLTSVTIPSSVTSIEGYAFYGCSGLTGVTIPNSVTIIGNYAFSYCRGLTSITIPNSVRSIGSNAFNYCSGLTSVAISNSVATINDFTFYGCSSLTSIIIPNSVTSIGKMVFEDCRALASVTIGNSVRTIGNEVFYNCSALTSVTIGNAVMSIGVSAFEKCSALTSVTIPSSVRIIQNYAFRDCSSLKTVYNLSSANIGTSSYGLSAIRVIKPTKSGTGANTIYQIDSTYTFVDNSASTSETEIPRSTIPSIDNLIYKDGTWKAKKVVLTDGEDSFEAPVAFTADSAVYTREFVNGNRSTLYLPFSAAEPAGFEVYDFSDFADNTISFTEHTGSIAAYTPYLVGYELAKDGSSTPCTITAANAAFPKSESASYHPVTHGGLTFQGVIERTTMGTSNYGYSNGYFVRSGGSAHLNPFRCCFEVSGSSPASTLMVDILEGEVGIDKVEDTPESHIRYSTDVYDMMGRLVRKNADSLRGLPQGIYIWKGKKVFAN